MKKVFLTIILTICLLFSVACNKDTPAEKSFEQYVSCYQTHCFSGENQNYQVSVSAGLREKTFLADGKVGETESYFTVKLIPLTVNAKTEGLSYTIHSSTGEVTGNFSQDKFSAALVSNFDGKSVIDSVSKVSVKIGDATEEIALKNRLESALTWQEILKLATAEFADYIAANTDDGVFNKEINIKYIKNRQNPNSDYYWYVSFIGENFDFCAVLLDPETGEIVTKR